MSEPLPPSVVQMCIDRDTASSDEVGSFFSDQAQVVMCSWELFGEVSEQEARDRIARTGEPFHPNGTLYKMWKVAEPFCQQLEALRSVRKSDNEESEAEVNVVAAAADDDVPNNEDDEYVVECILATADVHGHSYGLVKWAGYDMSESTWEPAENLTGAMDAVVTMWRYSAALRREQRLYRQGKYPNGNKPTTA